MTYRNEYFLSKRLKYFFSKVVLYTLMYSLNIQWNARFTTVYFKPFLIQESFELIINYFLIELAEVPGVARGFKRINKFEFWKKCWIFFSLCYSPGRGHSWVPSTNFSPFGPAVRPAIANTYINIYERRAYQIDK